MEIIHTLDKFEPLLSSVLTIGSYDGIHIGHKKIISSVISKSGNLSLPSVLITFHPHPKYIINDNSNKISLIQSKDDKIEMLDALGIDYLCIIDFNKRFSNLTAIDFLNQIIRLFNPHTIVIGYDHHFGKNRQGNSKFLKKYCDQNSIKLQIIKAVSNNGIIISSTIIRELINKGDIERANELLGSSFSFSCEAVKGAGRGKKITYPTANVVPCSRNQLLPKPGVYLVVGKFIGLKCFGMCNFGLRPTFNESKLIMEIHFFHDRLDDLYGKKIRVEFLERIRDEKRFPSPEDLIMQLTRDKQRCLAIKSKYE